MASQRDYIAHYGVKGQKWGTRRYQNDDGTLTAEGKARYGDKKQYKDEGAARKTVASEGGHYAFAKWREKRFKKKLDTIAKDRENLKRNTEDLKKPENADARRGLEAIAGKDLKGIHDEAKADLDKREKKYQSKLDAQSAANANLDAYRKHTSARKLYMQNAIMGTRGANNYRKARARGSSRGMAYLEFMVPGLRWHNNKKAYGKRIIHGDDQ